MGSIYDSIPTLNAAISSQHGCYLPECCVDDIPRGFHWSWLVVSNWNWPSKYSNSIFFACVAQGIVGSLQAINSFPAERAIILLECQAGTYKVSSYFMAKTAIDILTQLWPPMLLFTCIVYFLIGYQPVASKFFYYMLFVVLDRMFATSIATTITFFFVSVAVLAFVFEVCRLFDGFFASPAQMKQFPKWTFADALSWCNNHPIAKIGALLSTWKDMCSNSWFADHGS